MDKTTAATQIIVALIAAGLLNYLRDAVKTYRAARKASEPSARDAATVAQVDASLVVVAKARDELEEDNRRLRQTISEERIRHAEDRDRWDREKDALRSEIDGLEQRLRLLLTEVEQLRNRAS